MAEAIDVVNKPQHYGDIFAVKHTQCRAIARLLNFDAGCCWKYVWRAAKKECKEDPKQDLKKAINYLNDWAELYELRDGHDIGDYTAAKLLFNQLEEPDEYEQPVDHLKWEILREILEDTADVPTRLDSFEGIADAIDDLCEELYGSGLNDD